MSAVNQSQSSSRPRRSVGKLLEKARQYQDAFGSRGLWLALRTKLTRAERVEPALLPGDQRGVNVRLNGTDLDTYAKIFLQREYDIPLAKEPKAIIDAGANVGYASIFFAIKFPKAKIIAIEPETANFDRLKENTAAFPNVSLIKGALWPKSGFVDLLDPGIGSWGFEAAEAAGGHADVPTVEKVRALTVDEVMEQAGLSYVDVLKVDIEGGEKAVFADSPAWLKRVGVVMIELHDHRMPGCSRNFFVATREFNQEIRLGENVIMLRQEYMAATG
ncbi:MAG TPA: FkbM family methyltransferase [Verrucomicrobiae bacterium]|jgi:FkbM family methyltransferase